MPQTARATTMMTAAVANIQAHTPLSLLRGASWGTRSGGFDSVRFRYGSYVITLTMRCAHWRATHVRRFGFRKVRSCKCCLGQTLAAMPNTDAERESHLANSPLCSLLFSRYRGNGRSASRMRSQCLYVFLGPFPPPCRFLCPLLPPSSPLIRRTCETQSVHSGYSASAARIRSPT